MQLFKRIGLFLMVNILVVTTISIVLNVLGVKPYITAQGLDFGALMIFCLVWGMGGAFISLMMSKMIAKWSMGVQIIDPQSSDPEARRLVETVVETGIEQVVDRFDRGLGLLRFGRAVEAVVEELSE